MIFTCAPGEIVSSETGDGPPRFVVKQVTIDPKLLADDKEMLEDLITAAANDAVRRIEATTQEKMAGVTAGLPLPPGMKLPF